MNSDLFTKTRIVYKITFKTGHWYVGVTKATFAYRYKDYNQFCKGCRALLDKGVEFTAEVLHHGLTTQRMFEIERELIDVADPKCLNLKDGGQTGYASKVAVKVDGELEYFWSKKAFGDKYGYTKHQLELFSEGDVIGGISLVNWPRKEMKSMRTAFTVYHRDGREMTLTGTSELAKATGMSKASAKKVRYSGQRIFGWANHKE